MFLNPFPIQWLALLAYFILRVITGLVLLALGQRHFTHRHLLATTFSLSWWPYGLFSAWALVVAEIIIGTLLILGLYTQIAALCLALIATKLILFRQFRFDPLLPASSFYILLLGISLTLLITGAGAFAFDLPI